MMRSVKKLPAIVLMVCLAALCVSCRKLRPSSAGLVVESYPQTEIRVNSKFFKGWFEVTDVAVARGDNGLLQATVTVANLKGDCQIEYRYRWTDANGIEVTSGMTTWRPLVVGARERKLLTGMAPSKNVEDFILDVRFSYKSTGF